MPSFESFNIDPQTRCIRRSGGCLIYGHEWVYIAPHNLAILVTTKIFGPPSGSYDGPYPSREQALELTTHTPDLSLEDLQMGKIKTANRLIQLDPSMIQDFAMTFGMFELSIDSPPEPDSGIIAKAVLVENRCLILRLTQSATPTTDKQDFIVLMDIRNERPFAYYRIADSPSSRVPRIQYHPREPK